MIYTNPIGLQIVWDPQAGQSFPDGSATITTLAGLSCEVTFASTDGRVHSGPFSMTIAANGMTASYTTVRGDQSFPQAGVYVPQFRAKSSALDLVAKGQAFNVLARQ